MQKRCARAINNYRYLSFMVGLLIGTEILSFDKTRSLFEKVKPKRLGTLKKCLARHLDLSKVNAILHCFFHLIDHNLSGVWSSITSARAFDQQSHDFRILCVILWTRFTFWRTFPPRVVTAKHHFPGRRNGATQSLKTQHC